ncbi:MAG: hypothetical protein AAGF89_13160, partial [Bacteroidota bacterium]
MISNTRRSFLRQGLMTAMGLGVFPGCTVSHRNAWPPAVAGIGVITNTIKKELAEDCLGTLQRVRQLGYGFLETAGTRDPKRVRRADIMAADLRTPIGGLSIGHL